MLLQRSKSKIYGVKKAAVERGATLVEYALLVALIALVVMSAVRFLGNGTSERFDQINVPIESTNP